jgi:hypothetical protein
MSHTMNIKTEIKDLDALRAAADRLGYRVLSGNLALFSSEETGTGVMLPGRYGGAKQIDRVLWTGESKTRSLETRLYSDGRIQRRNARVDT